MSKISKGYIDRYKAPGWDLSVGKCSTDEGEQISLWQLLFPKITDTGSRRTSKKLAPLKSSAGVNFQRVTAWKHVFSTFQLMPDNYRHLTQFRKFDPIIQLANWGTITTIRDLREKLSERKLFPMAFGTYTASQIDHIYVGLWNIASRMRRVLTKFWHTFWGDVSRIVRGDVFAKFVALLCFCPHSCPHPVARRPPQYHV